MSRSTTVMQVHQIGSCPICVTLQQVTLDLAKQFPHPDDPVPGRQPASANVGTLEHAIAAIAHWCLAFSFKYCQQYMYIITYVYCVYIYILCSYLCSYITCIILYLYIYIYIPTYIHTYRQTDRHADRQTDIDTQIHRYIDTISNITTHMYCMCVCVYIYIYIYRILQAPARQLEMVLKYSAVSMCRQSQFPWIFAQALGVVMASLVDSGDIAVALYGRELAQFHRLLPI